MDIQVGDRVTYIYLEGDNTEVSTIVACNSEIKFLQNILEQEQTKLLKIERPKYEEIENKKLITEEEKEFLKDIIKWYKDITTIIFTTRDIDIYSGNRIVLCPDYPSGLTFKNVKKYKSYTLEELGL